MDYMQPQMAKLSTAVKCIKPQHNAEQIELERKEKKNKKLERNTRMAHFISCALRVATKEGSVSSWHLCYLE